MLSPFVMGGGNVNVTLYRNRSEVNKLDKILENEYSVPGILRDGSSITNPNITIEDDSSIINYNYAYIEDFNRYYFIENITSICAGLWNVQFRVDVLMSFKSEILECYATIDHTQENEITNYMDSGIWSKLVKDKTDIINFSGSSFLDSGEYILITAGG